MQIVSDVPSVIISGMDCVDFMDAWISNFVDSEAEDVGFTHALTLSLIHGDLKAYYADNEGGVIIFMHDKIYRLFIRNGKSDKMVLSIERADFITAKNKLKAIVESNIKYTDADMTSLGKYKIIQKLYLAFYDNKPKRKKHKNEP